MSDNLKKARQKLWFYQKRLNSFPDINIVINDVCWFNMKDATISTDLPEEIPEPFLKMKLSDYDFQRILHRDLHYNNACVGMKIRFDRKPNIYIPDVSTLMCFFHL